MIKFALAAAAVTLALSSVTPIVAQAKDVGRPLPCKTYPNGKKACGMPSGSGGAYGEPSNDPNGVNAKPGDLASPNQNTVSKDKDTAATVAAKGNGDKPASSKVPKTLGQ